MIYVGKTYGGNAYRPISLPLTGGVTETLYLPWCRDLFVQVHIRYHTHT